MLLSTMLLRVVAAVMVLRCVLRGRVILRFVHGILWFVRGSLLLPGADSGQE